MARQGDREMSFAEHGHVVVRGLIGPELAAYLWQYTRMKTVYGLIRGQDRLVPTAASRYGDEAFEALLETIRPRIEAQLRSLRVADPGHLGHRAPGMERAPRRQEDQ